MYRNRIVLNSEIREQTISTYKMNRHHKTHDITIIYISN